MSATLARRLAARGIRDARVLGALALVPRAAFLPPGSEAEAELDEALPIGHGQTISQPYVVAYMTALLGLRGDERVLEVGTGSGYQAAVLALLAREVWSIELMPLLAARARAVLLDRLGFANLSLRTGDGAAGWPEAAPFDRIVVTAATASPPPALFRQLAPGGRLILPFGGPEDPQWLRVYEADPAGGHRHRDVLPVRFVPLVR